MSERKEAVREIELVSDEFLRMVAGIIGSSSAAERALAERDRRVAAGEDACVLWVRDKGLLLVGPRPQESDSER